MSALVNVPSAVTFACEQSDLGEQSPDGDPEHTEVAGPKRALAVGEPFTDGERDALVARLDRKGVEGRRRFTAADPRRQTDREDLGAHCSDEPLEIGKPTRVDPGTDSWGRPADPSPDDEDDDWWATYEDES